MARSSGKAEEKRGRMAKHTHTHTHTHIHTHRKSANSGEVANRRREENINEK